MTPRKASMLANAVYKELAKPTTTLTGRQGLAQIEKLVPYITSKTQFDNHADLAYYVEHNSHLCDQPGYIQ